jgi:hypothetical protein
MSAQSNVRVVFVVLARIISVVFFASCKDSSRTSPTATTVTSIATPIPAVSSASSSRLPPLESDWLVRLPLEGFGKAVVAAPTGSTSPRPILVGVHALRDRPEWACGEWLGVTQGHPFILCPHGVPVNAGPNEGLAFVSVDDLRREIDAGIAALRARFGPYVADGPMIYGGFSRGAFYGVPIVADAPVRFPVVVLGEGGQSSWTDARASQFARGGGKRVLFVCSTAECEAQTPPALAILKRAGVEAKMISAGHIGHLVDDRVVTLIRSEWPWVVSDRAGALGPW